MRNLYLPISIVIAGLIIAGAIFYTKSPKEEPSLPLPEEKEELTEKFEIEKEDQVFGIIF